MSSLRSHTVCDRTRAGNKTHFVTIPGASQVALVVKNKKTACQCRTHKRCGFDPGVRKVPWRKVQQPTPVSLPGESHGQRSLLDYSPYGRKRVGHNWSNWACVQTSASQIYLSTNHFLTFYLKSTTLGQATVHGTGFRKCWAGGSSLV